MTTYQVISATLCRDFLTLKEAEEMFRRLPFAELILSTWRPCSMGRSSMELIATSKYLPALLHD